MIWKILVFIILLAPIPAYALQCRGGAINTGDSEYELLSKCGEPKYKSVIRTDNTGNPVVTRWFYRFSRDGLLYSVTIKHGTITNIKVKK